MKNHSPAWVLWHPLLLRTSILGLVLLIFLNPPTWLVLGHFFRLAGNQQTAAAHSEAYAEPSSLAKNNSGIVSCQILDKPGAKYVLQRDVASVGTCFSIQAENITLDLNRHSITYGTTPSKTAVFGILGIACWDSLLSNGIANGNPCGGKFDGLTVLNGGIVQAVGVPSFSDAIHLGQGGGNGLRVHHVEFTLQADSAIPIYTNYSGAGAIVHDNVIHNNVRTIQNRHQLQGMSIKFDNSKELRPGQLVYQNKIFGGAQGGIFLLTDGASAYGNEIRQDGRYSNDFALYMWGNKQQVYENRIDAVSGRGIQIAGGAVSINGHDEGGRGSAAHDNKIQVVELKHNCEYGEGASSCTGCQLGGAYGIQFDDNPQGDTSFRNSVTALADDCDAGALRITDSRMQENESHDDSFTALRVHPGSPGNAYAWDNAGPEGFTARNDVFIGDSASYHVNWDGAQNEICLSCTLGKGTYNPDPNYVTFSFQNGGSNPARNLHFRDTKFIGDARKDSFNMRPIDPSNWPGYAEYYIDWTITLSVRNEAGEAVRNADIAIWNLLGKLVYQGQSDVHGSVSTVLTEFKIYNTTTRVINESHTPHRIRISHKDCQSVDSSIDVTGSISPTIQIACASHK
jgi:hypothetical protein